MSLKFDQYQLEAINRLGENIVVSASAGAGKTAVLINRLMKRMLEDEVGIDEICALTFTDAAASEMKNRLLEALNDALESDIEITKKKFISKQIPLVETAHITTIHSFCLSIIKDYGYIMDLDPIRSENILDEGIVKQYQEIALDKSIETWIERHQEIAEVTFNTIIKNPSNLKPLKSSIKTTAEYLLSKPNREKVKLQIKNYYNSNNFSDFDKELQKNLLNMYATLLEIVQESLKDFLLIEQKIMQIAKEHHASTDEKFIKNYEKHQNNHQYKQTILEDIGKLHKRILQADFSFYDDILTTLDFKMLVIPKTFFQINKELLDPFLYEEYVNKTETLQKNINDLLKVYQPKETVFDILHKQGPLVDHLIEMAELYIHYFEKEKERANGFDFDDFENYALRILQAKDGYVSNLLQSKYKEIMIDEFQDTNEFQDSIVRLISSGNNIFRVGDIKQSIYRFRGAEPSIMQSILDDKVYAKSIFFKQNFRSKFSIVEFNNLLYQEIMKFNHYSKFNTEDIVTAGNRLALDNSYPVEILYGNLDFEDTLNSEAKREIQSQLIANRIIELTSNEHYQFKDITILVRSHRLKKYLKEAFEKANIPHHIDDRSGFFTSKVVSQVISWLNFLIEPKDYYLVEVLLSPFIGLTVDDLAILSTQDSTLWEAVKLSYPDIYNLLQSTRNEWLKMPVSKILPSLYNINNTYHEKLSLQVKTNLDFLLEKAIAYENSNSPSLLGFISYIDGIEDENNEESTPIQDDENVVKVATIHQSKGLQYPVTFLWLTGKQTNLEFKENVLVDNELGIMLNHFDGPYNERQKSIIRTVAEFKQRNEDLEEYIRLLYVATTRAEERLILVDVGEEEPSTQQINKSLMYNFKSSLDLIYPIANQMNSIIQRNKSSHPQLAHLDEIPQIVSFNIKQIDEHYTMDVLTSISSSKTDIFKLRYSHPYTLYQTQIDKKFEFNANFIESTSYGTLLHETIEKMPNRLWTSEDIKSINKKIVPVLKSYNEDSFTQKLYQYPSIEKEFPFIYLENNSPKQGIIDFIAINKEEAVIVDFKSDNATFDQLIERYSDQLFMYKKALNILYPGLNIYTYIYSFHHKCYLEIK